MSDGPMTLEDETVQSKAIIVRKQLEDALFDRELMRG